MRTPFTPPPVRRIGLMLSILVALLGTISGCPEEMPGTNTGGARCTTHEDCSPPQTYCINGDCTAG